MSYRVSRIAWCGRWIRSLGKSGGLGKGCIRLRLWLRREKLGLIGFVFSVPAERDIVVNLFGEGGWGVFGVLEIGFVLRKKLDL